MIRVLVGVFALAGIGWLASQAWWLAIVMAVLLAAGLIGLLVLIAGSRSRYELVERPVSVTDVPRRQLRGGLRQITH